LQHANVQYSPKGFGAKPLSLRTTLVCLGEGSARSCRNAALERTLLDALKQRWLIV
jgi:hypothetical protein